MAQRTQMFCDHSDLAGLNRCGFKNMFRGHFE